MLQPTPTLTPHDLTNGPTLDVKHHRYLTARDGAIHLADFMNVSHRQLRVPVPLSTVRSAMLYFIGVIFTDCRPPKMMGRDTSQMTIAARMSRFNLLRWSRTVNRRTHKSMSISTDAIERHKPVSPSGSSKRPYKTFIPGVSERDVMEKTSRFAFFGLPLKRISVFSPPAVMRVTPAACYCWLAAILNRAYGFVSHSDLLERLAWLETVRVLVAPGGLAIFSRNCAAGQTP